MEGVAITGKVGEFVFHLHLYVCGLHNDASAGFLCDLLAAFQWCLSACECKLVENNSSE